MPNPLADPGDSAPELTRAQVAAQIAGRLAGTLSNATLCGWAFDQFYRVELETLRLEPGFEVLIGEALDELMFSDDPDFQLSDADLQAWIARLGGV